MRVHLRFFAILRDRAGTAEAPIDAQDGASVADVIDIVSTRFPDVAPHLHRAAVAINQEYVSRDATLHDGDELALIPPVSGG